MTAATGPARASALDDDPALAVAQSLWGRGNLSPLDTVFGEEALVRLVPAGGFGFIGRRLGQRMRKFADDTKSWVDAAEVETELSRLGAKKKSTISAAAWNDGAATFKPDRYRAFFVLEGGALGCPLQTLYGKSAAALKVGGKLFAADLTRVAADAAGAAGGPREAASRALHAPDEHADAMTAAHLGIERSYDMTPSFLATIRGGFLQSIRMLEGLRTLDKPDRARRAHAFALQLETWGLLYKLAEKRRIAATGFVAVKLK